jgi:acylphosphatase
VGFRWFVLRKAQELGVGGWVRNLPDGQVEVMGTGSAESLDRLEAHLRAGPRLSRVESVEKSDVPHEAVDQISFEIK